MRFPAYFILFFGSAMAMAQGPANNWYFGANAGITFNTSPPSSLFDGKLNTLEGCATISNDNGELLFYTDGTTVYNRNGDIMENGTGLLGDQSSSQSAIIIPQPQSSTIFYIFTVDVLSSGFEEDLETDGVNYSVVDFSSNPDGAVTIKNVNLLAFSAEKLSAVIKGCDSDTVWMVALSTNTAQIPLNNRPQESFNTFYSYAVTPEGISRNPIKSSLSVDIFDQRGNLKFSPNGKKLAAANASAGLYLLDFNSENGRISNPVFVNMNSPDFAPYGVEFSPNSRYLYVHSSNDGNPMLPSALHTSSLFQFDVENTDISQSKVVLDEQNLFRGSLQLGPDGKIYRALSSGYFTGLPYLGVIENPNAEGLTSNYNDRAINLRNGLSHQGLPPFNQSLFNKIDIIRNNLSNTELNLCSDEEYTLSYEYSPGADYTWYKDGVEIPTPNNPEYKVKNDPTKTLPYTEVYELILDFNDGSCEKTGIAEVTFYPYPEMPSQSLKLIQCEDSSTFDGLSVFDLNQLIPELTSNNDIFSVTFFETATDANSAQNAVEPVGYENLTPSQTLYARVSAPSDCSVIVPFELVVSTTDTNNVILELCDEEDSGFRTFILENAESELLAGQAPEIEISYYATMEAALLEDSNLQLNQRHQNSTAYNSVIYARLENNNACFAISEVELRVYKRPEFELAEEKIYCNNTFPETISITPDLNLDPSFNYTFEWFPEGQNTPELQTNLTGTHTLTITNGQTGCSRTKTVNINEKDLAVIENIEVTDASENNSAFIIISGKGEFEYSLTNGGPFQDENIFTGLSPGFYTAYIRSKEGCGVSEQDFNIIGFPGFFTPDGDGYNDLWEIKGITDVIRENTTIHIFDRYGKLLKELDPASQGWDGTFNGQPLPADDYWFLIILSDGREFKSHFTLIR